MKKKLSKLLFLFAIIFSVSLSSSAQIYVKIRPPGPIIVRPPQPSRAHVWIGEDWESHEGTYRYSGGHWATPPHRGYTRRSGYWKQTRHGQIWVQGSWRRGRR
jgi:hypothetical protein